jgi:hypothetical protein
LAYQKKLVVKVSLIIVNDRLAMSRARDGKGRDGVRAPRGPDLSGDIAAGVRPTEAQRRYLERGLTANWRQAAAVRPGRPRSVEEDNRILRDPRLGGALGSKSDQAGLAGLPAHPALAREAGDQRGDPYGARV